MGGGRLLLGVAMPSTDPNAHNPSRTSRKASRRGESRRRKNLKKKGEQRLHWQGRSTHLPSENTNGIFSKRMSYAQEKVPSESEEYVNRAKGMEATLSQKTCTSRAGRQLLPSCSPLQTRMYDSASESLKSRHPDRGLHHQHPRQREETPPTTHPQREKQPHKKG